MNLIVHLPNLKFVSVNQKYLSRTFILTKEYRSFKDLIAMSTRHQQTDQGLTFYHDRFYKVEIDLSMYLDIDNPVKCILDGMCQVLGFNDRNILKLFVNKTPIKRGHMGFLRVWIEEICSGGDNKPLRVT